MVSLKDISADCGVSIATVSKALNNKSDIGEETKARVMESARRLGYFPNLAAKSLKTNRTQNIGVLFADAAQSGLTHDYFSFVLDSFKRAVERKGYDITFINSSKDGENRMTYLDRCRSRGFDGIVVASILFDDPEVQELVQSDVPMVTIDYALDNRTVVISDNAKGMRDLFQYIYGRGHRRIAYIHGEDCVVTANRLNSFLDSAQERGLTIPDAYMRMAPYRDTAAAFRRTEELLALPEPPTCILYPDDYASFGGMRAIRQAGLRIPDDISIAGYDGTRLAENLEPALTTIQQDTEEIGRIAAEQLVEIIEHPQEDTQQVFTVEGKLFEGATVRDLPNSTGG